MTRQSSVIATASGKLDQTVSAETPDGMPNVRVHVRPWWVRVLVRFAYVYASAFIGLYGGFTFIPVANDLFPILTWGQQVAVVAQMALLAAFPSLLKNVVTFLGDLDKQFPDLAS
jgi:hypothetical protein